MRWRSVSAIGNSVCCICSLLVPHPVILAKLDPWNVHLYVFMYVRGHTLTITATGPAFNTLQFPNTDCISLPSSGCVTTTATYVRLVDVSATIDAGHSVGRPVVTKAQLAVLHWVTVGTNVPAGAQRVNAVALIRFQGNPCGIGDRQRVCWNTLLPKYFDFSLYIIILPLLNFQSFVPGG